MTRVIHKYPLHTLQGPQLVWLPPNAEFLSCQMQHHLATMWFSVDPDKVPVNWIFEIVFTGDPVPEPADYLATLQDYGIVFHVFRLKG